MFSRSLKVGTTTTARTGGDATSQSLRRPDQPRSRPFRTGTIRSLMRQVPALPVVGSFAERLLAQDLPDLPPPARREVVAFIARRVEGLPSFTRFGVLTLGYVFRTILAVPGGWALARLVMKLPLPLVSEYPRLMRSLAFAYVWEHWPTTTPTGAVA